MMYILLSAAAWGLGFAIGVYNYMNSLIADIAPAYARPGWRPDGRAFGALSVASNFFLVSALIILRWGDVVDFDLVTFLAVAAVVALLTSVLAHYAAKDIVKKWHAQRRPDEEEHD
jgi:hypothetical protein